MQNVCTSDLVVSQFRYRRMCPEELAMAPASWCPRKTRRLVLVGICLTTLLLCASLVFRLTYHVPAGLVGQWEGIEKPDQIVTIGDDGSLRTHYRSVNRATVTH